MSELEVQESVETGVSTEFLERVVAAVREFSERPNLAVSLLLTGDEEIAELHGRFLNDPTPTDVMSFPLDDNSVDLVVNVERAREVAARHGHDDAAEIALYVVHGMLHAVGFDDTTTDARARMRAAERAVMHALELRVASVDGDV